MDIIALIISYLMMIFSAFNFLFPSIPTPSVPDVPTTDVVVEETTTEAPVTEAPTTECRHIGGTPSCTSKAVCIRCGEQYGEGGSHKYETITMKPTCETDGYTTYRCSVCNDTYKEDLPALGHEYNSRVIEPTCEESGRTVYTCKNCGKYYSENETPALGHKYENMGETAPDCVNKGYFTFTCANCGDTYKEETDVALGHNYVAVITAPTCKDGGYTTHTCPGCGDSYTTDETPATGHSFTNYVSDNNASCRHDGTKTAYCDNGCGLTSTLYDEGSILPHKDDNKDKHCDVGGEELNMEFTHLTYPSQAVKTPDEWLLTVEKLTKRADKNDDDIYVSAQGYNDANGIVISPYYTVKVDGTDVPVYGALTYVGSTGKGALHSFSEIYVEKGEYCTFEIEINSASFNITEAKVIPESYGEKVVVENGKATAILSGFGAHTFLFNNENQAYTYTIFVREEIDEEAEIAALRAQGYTVTVVEGFLTHDYTCFSGPSTAKNVIYLKKGAYVTANHKFEINSDEDNAGISETTENGEAASDNNGMGLNRFPFIGIHNTSDIKILGYGVLDLTDLDRGERRGMVIDFSNNIEIRGIKLINSPEWTFISYRTDGLTVKDVDVFGYRQNSDAFDICNSKNVTVDGCFARSGDDIFAVKALGGDANAVSENITFTNCYAWAAKARAFGIFGESNRSITGVTFKDSYLLMHDATWDERRIPAIGIVAESADANNGAIAVRDITFENIEISRNYSTAANIIIFEQITNSFTIDNVLFKNISYQSNSKKNIIDKYTTTGSITNVTFEGTVCGGTNVVDSNKMNYFTDEAVTYIKVK